MMANTACSAYSVKGEPITIGVLFSTANAAVASDCSHGKWPVMRGPRDHCSMPQVCDPLMTSESVQRSWHANYSDKTDQTP